MMEKLKLKTFAPALICLLFFAAVAPLPTFGTADFTAASGMVQSDDADGRAWAEYIVAEAGAKTDMEKIRAVYEWYTGNMEYDREILAAVRDLPAGEHALRIPRHDYLSVLASAALYASGESGLRPKSLCGGYVHGVAGSLRALGIPVKIEIGKVMRTAGKGETYFDANGKKRVSSGRGETPHRYFNGRWVGIADLHARLSIWSESRGRWISADPTFDSIMGDGSYFDMDADRYAEHWTFMYISSEKMPGAWKENPVPPVKIPPPPAISVQYR